MDDSTMEQLTESSELLLEQLQASDSESARFSAIEKHLKTWTCPSLSITFPKGVEWFNVSEEITPEKLRGKLVVLDFFTYCCINCMHILPHLKELEEEITTERGLVIIGVHSAKFDNEKDSTNLISAVQRYNISHPVINDKNTALWNALNICCWPTLLILGPQSKPLLILMGEGHKNALFTFTRAAIDYYNKLNQISNHSLPVSLASRLLQQRNEPLMFPGKITCNPCDLLAISDSGNNRVIIATKNGNVRHVIGGDGCGFVDGTFGQCKFNSPQGVTFLNEDVLFVADTENHAVRKIDLVRQRVETICGTGVQGTDYIGGKLGKSQSISSPWDVATYKPSNSEPMLLIAMAGTHQIWAYFPNDSNWWKNTHYSAGTCVNIVGSGREENRNNAYPKNAAFAQPSGFALVQSTHELYVADSESSSIRRVSLIDGKVTAVVGGTREPQNLFAYGDVDGVGIAAKLQHPLHVATCTESLVYVADTYNHKIKKIDTQNNRIDTCTFSNNAQLNEPGGICFDTARINLFVADTNNHVIKIIDISSGKCQNLHLKFPVATDSCQVIEMVATQPSSIRFQITFEFQDVKLTTDAPTKVNLTLSNESWKANCPKTFTNPLIFNVDINELAVNEDNYVRVDVSLVVCKNQVCMPIKDGFLIKFTRGQSPVKDVDLTLNVGEKGLSKRS